jgi:Zinc finger, C3HC4 type (RING finger)
LRLSRGVSSATSRHYEDDGGEVNSGRLPSPACVAITLKGRRNSSDESHAVDNEDDNGERQPKEEDDDEEADERTAIMGTLSARSGSSSARSTARGTRHEGEGAGEGSARTPSSAATATATLPTPRKRAALLALPAAVAGRMQLPRGLAAISPRIFTAAAELFSPQSVSSARRDAIGIAADNGGTAMGASSSAIDVAPASGSFASASPTHGTHHSWISAAARAEACAAVGVPQSLVQAHAEARAQAKQRPARPATASIISAKGTAPSAPEAGVPAIVTTLRRVQRSYSASSAAGMLQLLPRLDTGKAATAATEAKEGDSTGDTTTTARGIGNTTPIARLTRPPCAICFDDPACAVFLECGHAGCCPACAKIIVEGSYRTTASPDGDTTSSIGGTGLCPLCRGFVTQIVLIGPDVVTSDGRTVAQCVPQAYWRSPPVTTAAASGEDASSARANK